MEEAKPKGKLIKRIYLDVETSSFQSLVDLLTPYFEKETVKTDVLENIINGTDGDGVSVKYPFAGELKREDVPVFHGFLGDEDVGVYKVSIRPISVARMIEPIAYCQYYNIAVPNTKESDTFSKLYFIERIDLYDDNTFDVAIGT